MENDLPKDMFECCLDRYPDMPSVVLIRSIELKHFPLEYLKAPVLDVCCGDGFFTSCLGLQDVIGCDIDQHAIDRAGRLTGTYARVLRSDARDLKVFDDAAFNTVFSNCGLEHVDGIDRALGSISRVLRPGGCLIMSVPHANLNQWFFPNAVLSSIGLPSYGSRLCREYNRKQHHVNICSLAVWESSLENNGLKIEKNFYLFQKKEYVFVTFFESFVLDSFPGPLFRRIYSVCRKALRLETQKSALRKILKPIYVGSRELDSGGELFIVACKR